MKEAKTEAEKIIANYRAEMEATYQVALAKVCYTCVFVVLFLFHTLVILDEIFCKLNAFACPFALFTFLLLCSTQQSNNTSGTAGSELEASTNTGIKDMQ